MQLSAGDRVASYEILGPLGAGGMGEVYRARDAKLGRDVALKILPAELATNPESLRRFEQEARAASALNHPNIVTIFDIGQTDSMAWIAMELVDGVDLRTLQREEPSLRDLIRIAVKVAAALAAAHDRGIIHRDLKPDNVMVTSDGFVKILDFGLAKQIRATSSDDTTLPHTTPGTVFGTVAYMSPEQATGREMDARADQFSFGVMLYEMVTHARPFERGSKAETMAAIIRDEAPAPSTLQPSVPQALDRVVQRCLAKAPRDRYGSTHDLVHDLRSVREALTSPSHGSVRTTGRGAARSPAARRVIAVASLAIVAAAAVSGVKLWRKASLEAAGQITTVAVLPFSAAGGTSEAKVLADGFANRVASRLADVRDLRVNPPHGGAAVGEGEDARVVARRKNVAAVIRGAIGREGGRIAVAYELIDGTSGDRLHSGSVSRTAGDLFGAEDEVVSGLLGALARSEPVRPPARAAILGEPEQQKLVQAVGLMQQVRSEESVNRAIALLESILHNARDSGSVNALLARALLYKATLTRRPALIEQAMIYATRGVALAPADADAHITLGHLRNASGRHADALDSFERALALRPRSSDAVAGLADAYRGVGRAADAETMYRRAIALRPDAAGTYMKYGGFCYANGRHAEAVKHFRRAAELMPDFALAFTNLGAALQALGRGEEAMAAHRKAIAIEPTPAGYSNLGTLQFQLGRYDDAVQSFERAVELAPSDFLMWANLADARQWSSAPRELVTQTYARAAETARESLRINPRQARTRATLAVCLARSGDPAGAQEEIVAALETDPENAVVLYRAAVVSLLRGSHDSALAWLEKSIAAGYPAAAAASDPELRELSTMPAFQKLIEPGRSS